MNRDLLIDQVHVKY